MQRCNFVFIKKYPKHWLVDCTHAAHFPINIGKKI